MSPASYAVIEAEARVVQRVYERYTVAGLSIGAIARWLNSEGVATRKRTGRWERSVVWAMLRNPAYRGAAAFGKTFGSLAAFASRGHCAGAVALSRATASATNVRRAVD